MEIFRSSDFINNMTVILYSKVNNNLNNLIKEIRILFGEKLIFKYDNSYCNLHCLIPCICLFDEQVNIEVILLPEITYHPNSVFDYNYVDNHLSTEVRREFALNKYFISNSIGSICGGKLRKKLTLEMNDNNQINNLFNQKSKKNMVKNPIFWRQQLICMNSINIFCYYLIYKSTKTIKT